MQQTTFTYTPVPKVATANRTINTLKRIIAETGHWARENGNTELDKAMRDAYGLAVTCWTEIDEGLMQLSQAVRQIERGNTTGAVESIGFAVKYMNRWQDRDGAIGNAECVTEEELTGLTLTDGSTVPASCASAKIDRLDDLERAVKGLTLVKSVFGSDAKLIIKHHSLNTEALREVWPQLLDRLLSPCPGAITPKRLDEAASRGPGRPSAT